MRMPLNGADAAAAGAVVVMSVCLSSICIHLTFFVRVRTRFRKIK